MFDRHQMAAGQPIAPNDREREVATASAGVANAEIAASLSMCEATVKVHVSRLLDKLNVRAACRERSWSTTPHTPGRRLSPQEPTKSVLACHSFVAALRSWLRRDELWGWLLVK